MRVVVLTNGSSHGAEILRALSERSIPITAIIVERSNRSAKEKLRRSVRKYGYIQTAHDVLGLLRAKMAAGPPPVPYQTYSDCIRNVADFNAAESVQLLAEFSPDIVVVAGAPILKAPVISTAKAAVLNAHPGLLPKYRGVDVIPWAVLNGDPVGVTIHQVDPGIDTGAVVLQERICLEPADNLASLRRKAEVLAGRLMAEAVSVALSQGRVTAIPQTEDLSPLYRRMSPAMLRKAEKRMRSK